MEKGIKLVIKIKRLLRGIGCPRWLHHFGPKKYEFKHHLLGFLMMEVFQLSLRRAEKLLRMFGMKVPTYSALSKSRKNIPSWIWHKLIKLTSGLQHPTAVIEGTGFSTTNPSYHYIKRIDSKNPVKNYAKLSMIYDVRTHKAIALNVRMKHAHDIRDAKLLISKCKGLKYLLADKGYDAEWLHEYCVDRRIKTVIPKKKNIHKGFYRKNK